MTDAADVNLELNPGNTTVRMKKPKRVLHFSDGVLEEYSDSETDEQPTETDTTIATTPEDWGPWLWLKLRETGETTLAACDYVGEALASFLGITSPKYQYELEEYQRMVAKKLEQEENAKGWTQATGTDVTSDVLTEQPLNNNSPTSV